MESDTKDDGDDNEHDVHSPCSQACSETKIGPVLLVLPSQPHALVFLTPLVDVPFCCSA